MSSPVCPLFQKVALSDILVEIGKSITTLVRIRIFWWSLVLQLAYIHWSIHKYFLNAVISQKKVYSDRTNAIFCQTFPALYTVSNSLGQKSGKTVTTMEFLLLNCLKKFPNTCLMQNKLLKMQFTMANFQYKVLKSENGISWLLFLATKWACIFTLFQI